MAKILPKQHKFIQAYVACLNGSEAARRAGYSPHSAHVQASELLAKPEIREEVDRLIKLQSRMPKEEIIARLERIATADISIFFLPGGLELDYEAIKQNGDLIQSIWVTKEGPRLRLHDSLGALELLGKKEALFVERTLVSDLEGMEIKDAKSNGKAPRRSSAPAPRVTEED